MRTLLCISLLSTAVFANTCLSLSSGNWNDSSKWTTCGGGVPGNGDTAKIGQGHTITVPAGYHAVVGLSAAGNTQAASTNTTLSAAITTTSQTAITVASGTGIANGAYIILQKESTNTNEIVQVSAGGGTTSLTIVRAQLGTAASVHANGASVYAGAIPAISCDGSAYYGANGTGILAIADTGWLTLRGNVEQCTAVWTVGKDAIIEHDSSAATTPSTTHYKWVIGSYLFPDTAVLQIRGKLGHRTLIRNATTSGTFYGFTYYFGAAQGSGQFDFAYVTIDGCGGSTPCTDGHNHSATTPFIAACDHCLVTNSGYLGSTIGFPGGAANVSKFTNSTFTSSADASSIVINLSTSSAAASTLDTIYTDGQISLGGNNNNNAFGTHLRNLVIRLPHRAGGAAFGITLNGYNFAVGEYDRVMRITDTGEATSNYVQIPGGYATRIMCLSHSTSNPHCFQGPIGITGATDTIDGGWFENIGGGTDGDTTGSTSFAGQAIIRNGVWPCPIDTGINMSIFNMSVASVHTWAMYNNTYCGAEDAAGSARGFGFEVAGTAPVGMLAGARNNIVFCATGVPCYLIHQGPTGTDSVGTYQKVDYNWQWNVSAGPYYQQSGTPYTSYNPNPPGAHDSTGNPQFVQQRHFLDWGQLLDPAITSWTDIVTRFSHMNDDSGFDPRFTLLNAYNWLRAGYVPQNPAVYTAGDTGGQVGAMNLIPSKLTGPTKTAGPGVVK
jgi:hypothetical protein